MKEKKMSEPRLSGLNDEQDVGKNKILKSSNHANLDSDNMKQGWEIKKLGEVLVKTEMVDPTKNPDKEFTYLDVSIFSCTFSGFLFHQESSFPNSYSQTPPANSFQKVLWRF